MSDDPQQPVQIQHGPLTETPAPPRVAPSEEPPADAGRREGEWVADHSHETRDIRPALGTGGAPGRWRRAVDGARVALQRRGWADAQWSYLFNADTSYAPAEPEPGQVAAASRRMRGGSDLPPVHGPMIKPPVWTWEVPVYFWFGGIAAGSSFIALACDLSGDEKSARIARAVALGAVLPCPPLLILDLGRPARFLNMLRVFKPRSPMSMGAWCLVAFSMAATASVGADVLGRRREAAAIGAVNAVLGGYLGSYTGVLLASTAVPLWARSRLFLGPIFVATGAATGAAASRLVLVAAGLPPDHPTRRALGWVETGAMTAELALSTVNERRLGKHASGLEQGAPGKLFKAAKWLVLTGLASRSIRKRFGRPVHDVASVMYLLAGLCFRFAWVDAGKLSARDDESVATMAREPR